MKKKIKVLGGVICAAAVLAAIPSVLYLKVLPAAVSNPRVISFVEKNVNKYTDLNVEIKNPVLKTSFSPVIAFKTDKIKLAKNDIEIFAVENLDTEISFKDLFKKRIILNRFGLDYIFADVNKLMALAPRQEEQKQQKNDWEIDFFDSVLYLKKSLILYKLEPDVYVKLNADNLKIDNTQKVEKFVHFNIDTKIKKGDKILHFAIADKNRVVIKDKTLLVNDCVLDINKSNVHINADASRKTGLNVNLSSKKFKVKDVIDIVDSNIIINNGSEMLAFFKDMNGDFDFNINMKNNDLNGTVNLNKSSLKIIPVSNLPVTVNKGTVVLTSNDITLKDIEGYYGSQQTNKIAVNGIMKDYTKSCDTEVTITTVATNDFAKNYLSKLVGIPLEIVGKAGTRIIVKSIYNKIDVDWASKLAKGSDILVDGASLTPANWDRAVQADLHFENNILNIKDINYYIAQEIVKGSKVKPVLTLNGNVDCSKPIPFVQDLGFNIPDPLPSEFLNVLIGQRLFKGGKFSGDLAVLNNGPYPVIKGNMKAEGIRIPSQRIAIKNGELFTDRDTIHLVADGRYKRTQFDFAGDIANGIKYPIVIKNVNFGMDKIDIDKILQSFNKQNTDAVKQPQNVVPESVMEDENSEIADEAVVFDVNNLIIERCIFRLKEGKYKDINFGNLAANLTLDKNNILQLKSNRFDIAEGISSVKVFCDLKKHKYNIKLGAKDVNSDLMSTTLLNLPREISGKASGIIDLYTDDSLKLNGAIKFAVNDGQIQKIGLVEYVMKFAALFRNPLVMISPSTISDIVNIPEGKFNKISGELLMKNNVIELLKIKSSSPQLSSFIIGRYDIEKSDAMLRIYTKFSSEKKGFAGALRSFSLNSLANRIPLSSRNDAQYYAAELGQLPKLEVGEEQAQVFLTKVDGDVVNNNFLSSLKKIK